jgi:hypothetical protein
MVGQEFGIAQLIGQQRVVGLLELPYLELVMMHFLII